MKTGNTSNSQDMNTKIHLHRMQIYTSIYTHTLCLYCCLLLLFSFFLYVHHITLHLSLFLLLLPPYFFVWIFFFKFFPFHPLENPYICIHSDWAIVIAGNRINHKHIIFVSFLLYSLIELFVSHFLYFSLPSLSCWLVCLFIWPFS